MEFILKNKPFAIRSAELFATIPNPNSLRKSWLCKYHPEADPRPFWSLEVWAEGEWYEGDEEEEMGGVEARATAEEMRFPIRRWTYVQGQTVEWAGPYDEKVGGPYGVFYLEEHDIIRRARLRFTERDGTAFRFEWEGVCNVYGDEGYERDVPFSTAGWARFTGVTVYGGGADTDESLRGRLAQYFDPRDFVQGSLLSRSDRHGYFRRVKSSHAVFTPSDARAA
ncbi:MAG TPA: hypothetical protein VGX92_21335 [Pyrinomonadaceae bacterium]|jgi:hypothetical protein|nr:hypothetical protein [Pyrinomonadaceae bacterium]